MDISADIKIITAMLDKVKNPSIRFSIIELLTKLKKNGVDERISTEQYNQELEEARAEYKRGEFTSHEDVEKDAAKW